MLKSKIQQHIYMIFICLIIFLSLRCFYLADSDSRVLDLAVIVEMAFFVYTYSTCPGKKSRYRILFLIPLLLAVTSSLSAVYSYGQPFFLGFRAQRHWVAALLMYFPISRLLNSGKLKTEHLLNVLDALNLVYLFLVVVQYILGTSFWILDVHYYHRYGAIRLYVTICFLEISYFRHLIRLFSARRIQVRDFFFVAGALFVHLFITKSRMALLALLAASGLALLVQKTTKRKIFLLGMSAVFLVGILCSDIGTGIFQTLEAVLTNTNNPEGTVLIRLIGREFYYGKLWSDPVNAVFGCGFANIDWPRTVAESGIADKIYYVDQGLLGLVFYYGVIFALWMGILYIVLIKDAWKGGRMDSCFYLLYGVLGIYTILPGCYEVNISFSMTAAMVGYAVQNRQESDQDSIREEDCAKKENESGEKRGEEL